MDFAILVQNILKTQIGFKTYQKTFQYLGIFFFSKKVYKNFVIVYLG